MGLDSVELVMEIEKAFGIKIPDSEAEKILTVGDFHNSVWNHLSDRHSNRCNSQILFYKLRSFFINTIGLERSLFRPDTQLNNIFPLENRRTKYSEFEKIINLKLPSLVLPKKWNTLLNNFGFISITGTLLYAAIVRFFFNQSFWIFLTPIAAIILTYIFSELLTPKRIVINPETVRKFTEKTLAINFNSLTKDAGVNRNEVENVINHIIVDKIGVDWDEISPEKSLTDDLGVD